MNHFSISQINQFSREQFIETFGKVFENSPWIAEAIWPERPFKDLQNLHAALCKTVFAAGENPQLELIQAHPDLVGRAALSGNLTAESKREQTSAGLGDLTPEEIVLFQKNNRAYREKFGFPFVICARLNKKEAILHGFETRLKNSREEEIRAALEEISKIAYLRLQDIVAA